MKKFLLIVSLITCHAVHAQQIPSYGQYFVNPFLYNPAMAGLSDTPRAFSLFRKQWAGVPGAPETQALTIDGPVNSRKVGLGLTLYNDVNNIISKMGGLATYSYHLPLSGEHTLSMGLSLGFSRTKIFFDRLQAENPFDDIILNNFNTGTSFDGNMGVSYAFRKLRVGASAFQLFQNNIQFSDDAGSQKIGYKLIRHYLLSAQYAFMLDNNNIKLEPIVLLKSAQGLPAQLDFNLMATYRKKYWAGITYKMNAAAAFSLGAIIYDRITVGYNYEVATTAFSGYNAGTHEVIVGFSFLKSTSSAAIRSSSDFAELTRQNHEQYEMIDQINQENDKVKGDLAQKQQTIQQQNDEIQRLHEEIRNNRKEIDSVILISKVDIRTENFESETGNYFIVIGAHKTLRQAKEFQQIVRREIGLESSVIQKSNGSYYFVYTKKIGSRNEALDALHELKSTDSKKLFVGDPWVYKALY
jgi:type IX secretion system PorP/SprF family membrane protein